MYLVKFTNVGRGKKSFESKVKDLEPETLIEVVRKSRALMSSGIDVSVKEDGSGDVFAGFYCVGQFTSESIAHQFN